MKSYHLQVKEIKAETADAATISFWHPLHESIKYQAGQFLTIEVEIDGKKHRRSYSMSSSPSVDAALAVTVKRVTGGLVSNYLLDQVKNGDFLHVFEPAGNFVLDTEPAPKVFIGAGSGITPLMSMIKTALKSQPDQKLYLIFGNRTEGDIIFKKELDSLEAAHRDRFSIVYILSQPSNTWVGGTDRINQAQTVYYLKNLGVDLPKAVFYLCGPEGMMDEATQALKLLAIDTDRIHKEHFDSPKVAPIEMDSSEEHITRNVKVQYEGQTYDFDVLPHQTILEAALELDIDLPYSCQAGMCTACMGKCTSGTVKLDEEDGLTDKELAAGWILTCVARPKSDGVVIEIE